MFRPTRPARKIDFKQWAAAPGLISTTSGAGVFQSGNLAFTSPATILRWRGFVQMMFDSTVQVDDRLICNFGIGVFSTDSVAGAALPDPADEPEYPWVWHGQFGLFAFSTMGLATHPFGLASMRLEIDSKAMRKIKPGESLLLVGQTTNAVGAPVTIIHVGQLRVLIGT